MTKREYFELLDTIVDASAIEDKAGAHAFIAHELELLDRKSSKKGMTATQKANEELKALITEVLRDMGKPVTVTEMLSDGRLAGYTNQKISSMLRYMPNVVKVTEKKKSFFSLADGGSVVATD